MARISDTIADFIYSLIDETEDNQAIIQGLLVKRGMLLKVGEVEVDIS